MTRVCNLTELESLLRSCAVASASGADRATARRLARRAQQAATFLVASRDYGSDDSAGDALLLARDALEDAARGWTSATGFDVASAALRSVRQSDALLATLC